MDVRAQAERNRIFACVSGSRAYGTSTPESDVDVRGVFVADRLTVIDRAAVKSIESPEQAEGPGDTVIYELGKYARLLAEQNPNILDLAWAPEDCVIDAEPTWELLRARRGEFLCRKIRHTYGGYAFSQLKRIKGHSKWINNPQPEERPRPADFVSLVHDLTPDRRFLHGGFGPPGLPKDVGWTAVDIGNDFILLHEDAEGGGLADASGALRTVSREDARRLVEASQPSAILKFNRPEYDRVKSDWDNYWTWKHNRNEARAALEEKFSYDTKHGMHLIRLLRTAREALRDGEIQVRRPDAEELLAIRNGAWSYERIVATAEEIDAELEDAEKQSPLPLSLDRGKLAELVGDMYERHWASSRVSVAVARPDAPPDPRGRVIVIDVEHTGHTQEGRFRICEMAAVEIAGGHLTGRTFHAFVDPNAPINPYATRVHGLSRKALKGKPRFGDVIDGLFDFVGNSMVVMHDAQSDLRTLTADLALSGREPFPRERAGCTATMGRQLHPGKRLSLDTLCDLLDVDRTARARGHGALIDATLAAECLLVMASRDGYADIARFQPRQDKSRRSRVRMPMTSRIDEEAGLAIFDMPDGSALTTPLPDMPEGYLAVPVRGRILVTREAAEGRPRPENPLGPAVLYVRNGKVREAFVASDDAPGPKP